MLCYTNGIGNNNSNNKNSSLLLRKQVVLSGIATVSMLTMAIPDMEIFDVEILGWGV